MVQICGIRSSGSKAGGPRIHFTRIFTIQNSNKMLVHVDHTSWASVQLYFTRTTKEKTYGLHALFANIKATSLLSNYKAAVQAIVTVTSERQCSLWRQTASALCDVRAPVPTVTSQG